MSKISNKANSPSIPLFQRGRVFKSTLPPVWLLFAALAVLEAVLSYCDFPGLWKAALFLLSLAAVSSVPFFPGFRKLFSDYPTLYRKEIIPGLPAGLFLLLFLAGLGARFYRLTSLNAWPGLDEGLIGMFAIGLSEKWDWRFFYTFGQAPPLMIWSVACLFKLGAPPFLCLWLPPALASGATVAVGYSAARRFFSRSFSLICAGLLAFGYWPLILGRTCHQGLWIPLWACGCLYFLGRFLQAPPGISQRRESLLLGFVTGLGSFTFTPWPAMALAVSGTVLARLLPRRTRDPGSLLCFLSALAVSLAPFLLAVGKEGYGPHIQAMSAASGWFTLEHQALTAFSYVASLFWGSPETDSAYTAAFGGMLNPLWGAAFLTGVLSLVRNRSHGLVGWVALAFFLGLLPGFLSMNVEMFRVAVAFPFLFFTTASGVAQLLSQAPPERRKALFFLLLLCGAALDGGRILKEKSIPAMPENRQTSPLVDIHAYQILKQVEGQAGPGLVFTEFTETPFDETLFDAVYGFNAAENPRRAGPARWAGVFINPHFQPCLASRFPGAVWYNLGRDSSENPERMVGIIPLDGQNREILRRWTEAHHYFRQLSRAINSISEDQSYAEAERQFQAKPAFLAEDPFLEACYWERRAEFFYNYNYRAHYGDQLQALENAVQSGCPAAHLDYKLGGLLARKGQFVPARKAFQDALRQEPGYPDALGALEILKGMEATAGGKD